MQHSIFLNNQCKIDFHSIEQRQDFISELISRIKDGSLKSLITSIVNDNKNIKIENKDETYSLSLIKNQNFNKSKTLINLTNCEKRLKEEYNLISEEKIIILKIEKNISGYKIPIIAYELFS